MKRQFTGPQILIFLLIAAAVVIAITVAAPVIWHYVSAFSSELRAPR